MNAKKQAALYTPEVQSGLRALAVATSAFTGHAVDPDELFSAGETAVALNLPKFGGKSPAGFRHWAVAVGRNAMRTYLQSVDPLTRADRKSGATLESCRWLPEESTPADRGEKSDELSLLVARICKLPPIERDVVWGHFFDGKTFLAIGHDRRVSKQRIAQIEQSALKRLRRMYLQP